MATLAPMQPSLLDVLEEPRERPAAPTPSGGERTLEDLVLGAWEELAAARPAPCPLCGGALVPRFGAGARPVEASCGGCATAVG